MRREAHFKQMARFIALYLCISFATGACLGLTKTHPIIKEKEWDLVVLGDSKTWGVGEQFELMIEADQGVNVNLTVLPREDLRSADLLDILKTYAVYKKAVKKAEVILFVANPFDYTGTGFFDQSQKFDCSAEAMQRYQDDLEAILVEVFALRKGKATIIRTLDYYSSSNKEWQAWGKFEEYKTCWESMNAVISQVATKHKIPMAVIYQLFNGDNHSEDPNDKGYLRPDGEHPSEAGAKIIAQALRELGYDPLLP